jgi:hypothetical protein
MLSKKALAATAGVAAEKVYVEDVFSTWLYTGNGSTQTITNGIDLAGEGGLVWVKPRSGDYSGSHQLSDTARGANWVLFTNGTNAQFNRPNGCTGFTSTGFTLGTEITHNGTGTNYASWTFRKAEKFFDVVTYTGDGVSGKTIAHNLGSVPGMVIIKNLDQTNAWNCWHRSVTSPNSNWWQNYLTLNTTAASASWTTGLISEPTSSSFQVGTGGGVNNSGSTYVAYLFAHDAGGFGDSGNDSVVSCGSFSGVGEVTLGWEPQFLLVKQANSARDWYVIDTMRGFSRTSGIALSPNLSNAETDEFGSFMPPTATGFINNYFGSGTFIYIAIRRGPMKTPTDATKVFDLATYTASTNPEVKSTNLDYVDFFFNRDRASASTSAWDRLRGGKYLRTEVTNAEADSGYSLFDCNKSVRVFYWATGTQVNWMLRRAPGFFDVVAYTGTGANRTVSHNLGVAPELMIVKRRETTSAWMVYTSELGIDYRLQLHLTDAALSSSTNFWNATLPTSTVFSVGPQATVNASSGTYIAYLFATLTGVSKVGSYTGTGTTLNVDCGFTNGARFVLIKRTDSTGDWYVWDTARGIGGGNDPYLRLNSTAAEVTNTDFIDPLSSGFQISSTAPAAINANGGSFIFLAIA